MRVASIAGRQLVHDFFDTGRPESHWLAGLIAADGSIGTDERAWTLRQSGPEGRALVEHVRLRINHRLALSEQQPKQGAVSYGIYVPSSAMVGALKDRYGIVPRKTLTYTWPLLGGNAAFLRGYVDGDGCVSEYQTPRGRLFLHLSFVGTPDFVEGAMAVIPAAGRARTLKRCRNLAEVRYSGRHAWDAGAWIYADETLYASAKYRRYRSHVVSTRPDWLINRERREAVLALLGDGLSLRQVAAATGVHLSMVCAWKKGAKEEYMTTTPFRDDEEG